MVRKLGYYAALALLFGSVYGLTEAQDNLREATNNWQAAVGYGQMLYTVLGVLGGVGLWRRRPWTVTVTAAWAVSLAFVASVATFAFNDAGFAEEGTLRAVLAAGISVLVVGSLVVFVAHRHVRAPAAAATANATPR